MKLYKQTTNQAFGYTIKSGTSLFFIGEFGKNEPSLKPNLKSPRLNLKAFRSHLWCDFPLRNTHR
jgi:hypothetical protein